LIYTRETLVCSIHKCDMTPPLRDMTRSCVWHHSFMPVTWDKWQVSFAKEPYKRDYILLKRRIILRSLLIHACHLRIPRVFELQYSHVWHDSPTKWHDSLTTWHDTFICETWLVYDCQLIYMGGVGLWYGVAMISRLLRITGLFCKKAL